jgi:hypothetical protein
MAQRLIVHIGPRKTATTYLQRVLQLLAPDLASEGVLYPTHFRGREDYNHVSAITDVTHDTETKSDQRWEKRDHTAWPGLQASIAQWPGTAIISAEMLGGLRPDAARTVIEGLDADRIDIVITARDLARILPSSWQQHVRNTHSEGFGHYLRRRRRQRGEGSITEREKVWNTNRGQTFWRAYAYGSLIRRWAALVGTEHVHLVTLPPAGAPSTLLWDRFTAALDIPSLPAQAPELPRFVANVGSTAEEAAFLLAFNAEAARRGWKRPRINRYQQRLLASGFLERPDRGQPLALPADFVETVRDWAADDIADVATTGVTVHGELSDLAVPADLQGMTDLDPAAIAAAGAFAAIDALPQRKGRGKKPGANPSRPRAQREGA